MASSVREFQSRYGSDIDAAQHLHEAWTKLFESINKSQSSEAQAISHKQSSLRLMPDWKILLVCTLDGVTRSGGNPGRSS